MRAFLKAHKLISCHKLSSLHTEILHVIPGNGHLDENHRIKTDLGGCQHDGGLVYICTYVNASWIGGVIYVLSVHSSSTGGTDRGRR